MNEPSSDELYRVWQAAKAKADQYEEWHNRTQTVHRWDESAEFRAEGMFAEMDRLRELERQAEVRYRAAQAEHK